MIEFNHLKKYISSKVIIRDSSFALPNHGLILVKGKNGSGKTTLFNILTNVDNDYEGQILYQNKDINESNFFDNIKYIFQNGIFDEELTVIDNLLLPYKNKDVEKALLALKKFHIENLKDAKAGTLSAGERKKLSLTSIIYDDSPIVILDETLNNLDSKSKDEILAILKELSKDRLILLSSHLPSDEKYFDNILTFDERNHIQVMNEVPENGIIYHKSEKKIGSLGITKTIFKQNKIITLVYMLIIILFSCASLVCGSLSRTSNYGIDVQVRDEYIKHNFGLVQMNINHPNDLKPIYYIRNEALHFNDESFPVFYDEYSKIQLNIIEGEYTSNLKEYVISDLIYDYLVSEKIVSSYEELFSKNFDDGVKITGVYQHDDSYISKEYLDYLGDNKYIYFYDAFMRYSAFAGNVNNDFGAGKWNCYLTSDIIKMQGTFNNASVEILYEGEKNPLETFFGLNNLFNILFFTVSITALISIILYLEISYRKVKRIIMIYRLNNVSLKSIIFSLVNINLIILGTLLVGFGLSVLGTYISTLIFEANLVSTFFFFYPFVGKALLTILVLLLGTVLFTIIRFLPLVIMRKKRLIESNN